MTALKNKDGDPEKTTCTDLESLVSRLRIVVQTSLPSDKIVDIVKNEISHFDQSLPPPPKESDYQ